MEEKDRKTKKLSGCLLLAPVSSHSDILQCGLCPNKSTTIGNLGTACIRVPKG